MPAEKLSKTRFVQLIIILTALISAFLYKTLSYENPKNEQQIQQQK